MKTLSELPDIQEWRYLNRQRQFSEFESLQHIASKVGVQDIPISHLAGLISTFTQVATEYIKPITEPAAKEHAAQRAKRQVGIVALALIDAFEFRDKIVCPERKLIGGSSVVIEGFLDSPSTGFHFTDFLAQRLDVNPLDMTNGQELQLVCQRGQTNRLNLVDITYTRNIKGTHSALASVCLEATIGALNTTGYTLSPIQGAGDLAMCPGALPALAKDFKLIHQAILLPTLASESGPA